MTEAEELPVWARRIRRERESRGWSQTDAVRALRAHSTTELPDDAGNPAGEYQTSTVR